MHQGYSAIITHGKNKPLNNNNPQTNQNDSSEKKTARTELYQIQIILNYKEKHH